MTPHPRHLSKAKFEIQRYRQRLWRRLAILSQCHNARDISGLECQLQANVYFETWTIWKMRIGDFGNISESIAKGRTPGKALSITQNSVLPVWVLTEQIRSQARYFSEQPGRH
jgi:hypothetical protein